jgi:dTDP-4-amino-4,6-dideoxygalactose transaminase
LHRALNFGLEGGAAVGGGWGINGKLPEFSAAVGLAVLKEFPQVIRLRRSIVAKYAAIVSRFSGLKFPEDEGAAPWQTFPVLFPSSAEADRFVEAAKRNGVEVRRYYSPSLEDWPKVKKIDDCAAARSLSERMICLPVYSELATAEAEELFPRIEGCLRETLA